MAFQRHIENVLQHEMTRKSNTATTAFPFVQPTTHHCRLPLPCSPPFFSKSIFVCHCLPFHLLRAPCWTFDFLFPNILVHNISMPSLSTPDKCNIMFFCFFCGRLFVSWRRNWCGPQRDMPPADHILHKMVVRPRLRSVGLHHRQKKNRVDDDAFLPRRIVTTVLQTAF